MLPSASGRLNEARRAQGCSADLVALNCQGSDHRPAQNRTEQHGTARHGTAASNFELFALHRIVKVFFGRQSFAHFSGGRTSIKQWWALVTSDLPAGIALASLVFPLHAWQKLEEHRLQTMGNIENICLQNEASVTSVTSMVEMLIHAVIIRPLGLKNQFVHRF